MAENPRFHDVPKGYRFVARVVPICRDRAAGTDSTCEECGCCNHTWSDDCECGGDTCGCREARVEREASDG